MAFPTTALPLSVHLYYSGGWQDITAYVYKSHLYPFRFTRGYSDPNSGLTAGTGELYINNSDGRFSPRNPNSPLYGLIGRNTQIWVQADSSWRFVGSVPEWPSEWSDGGADVWVRVQCSGVVRRLQMGAPSLRSPIYRALHALSTTIGYWPMEGGTQAEVAGPDTDGARALSVKGAAPQWGGDTSFACSEALPTLQAGSLRFHVPSHPETDDCQVIFLLKIPEAGLSNNTEILDIGVNGTYDHYKIRYATGGGLYLQSVNDTTFSSTVVNTSGTGGFGLNGQPAIVSLTLLQSGVNLIWQMAVYRVNDPAVVVMTDGWTNQNIGTARTLFFNNGNGMTDCVLGHVWVTNDPTGDTTLGYLASATNAYAGDSPDTRMSRICAEAGLIYTGGGTSEVTMGAQGADTVMNLIAEVMAVSGMVWESRDSALGITYRTGSDLYNQAPALTISYADSIIPQAGLDPTEDDAMLVNDVTARRKDGASYRSVVTTGPTGTVSAGTYEGSYELSLHTDDQARNHAGWRVHLGTVDRPRYPTVELNMAIIAQDFAGELAAAKGLDVGSVIRITDLPAWLPADQVDLFVIGYEDEFWQFGWMIRLRCVPAELWHVFVLGDGEHGRLQPTSATLSAGVTAAATSWSVASSGAVFTTDAGALPMSCMCEGEEVTVTAITGASSPQTFTVTRSVNGVSKAHSLGAAVTLKAITALGI